MTSISRSGQAITSFNYNADGTAHDRTDRDPNGTTRQTTFTYTALGQLASATLPDSEGTATYTWRLDGSMATRTWGGSISGTYSYDTAKRPTGLTIKFGQTDAGTIARAYDRAGNATRETQTLSGVSTTLGLAGATTQVFEYDAGGRLTDSHFAADPDDPNSPALAPRTYTYDLDSNRTSVSESGVRFDYTYDVTDELIARSEHDADPANTGSFSFDGLGQMLTNQPSDQAAQATLVATSYEYDPAGHLTLIDTGSPATAVRFRIDALGRHATQSVGPAGAESSVTVYRYLGTSDTVSSSVTLEDTADPPVASLTYSAIDAIGDRLTTGTSEAFAYLLPDLHGNVVATMSAGSSPAFSAAYRYDAYGVTCDSYAPSGSIASPWRYQGRILESAEGSADLYDFSARSYDPGLGAFTSFDSVTGSAQNPLTLNRYLYANANPATLVDPDGHFAWAIPMAVACVESGFCEAVALVGIGALGAGFGYILASSGALEGSARAVAGVGDWALQQTTAGVDKLFGLHQSSRAAVTLALAGALKRNVPPINPEKSRLPPRYIPPILKSPNCGLRLAAPPTTSATHREVLLRAALGSRSGSLRRPLC